MKCNKLHAFMVAMMLFMIGFVLYFNEIKTSSSHSIFDSLQKGAQRTSDPMRILCYIHTCPQYHKTKAQAVKDTWGKRCDKLIFISSQPDDELGGVIAINVTESLPSLWWKEREAVKIIYDQYLHDYDWFLKTDDDTFVIMENLRYMLAAYDTENPIALGTPYFSDQNEFLDGGAGYIFSREAVRRYGVLGYSNSSLCAAPSFVYGEDTLISECLKNLGVLLHDARDDKGKERMLHYPAPDVIAGKMPETHRSMIKFKLANGTTSLSTMAISFHWLNVEEIYAMDYFIYKLKLFGFQ